MHSSKPSELTRPKPPTGSVADRMRPQPCWFTPRRQERGTSIRLFDITDKLCWLGRRESGKALQTSTQCRQRCAALWPGSARSSGCGAARPMRQPPSCSRYFGWAGARSLRGTPSTHNGTKIDLLAVAPKTVDIWVDQLCTLEYLPKGPLFWEAITAPGFWQAGGVVSVPAFRVAKTVVACASLAMQAARWAAEIHVLLRVRGWDDTRAAATRRRARPPRARLSSASGRRLLRRLLVRFPIGFPPSFPLLARQSSRPTHVQRAQLAVGTSFRLWGSSFGPLRQTCGAVYWERADALCRSCREHPGGRTPQLRKLRSGLLPNKRYPGWTVEDVGRPSLDEATTLVAQWESCEAGLGRTVMGPTTPKKQRFAPQAAALELWECISWAAKTGDSAMKRWDQGRPGLLAEYGLNDQLVTKLAFKAEGSNARKTD